MSSFEWKNDIVDSIKDELIKAATTTGIHFVIKAANVKPSKVFLDVLDIIKFAGGIGRGVLVKYYAVYKK